MVHATLNSCGSPFDFELPAVADEFMPWRRIQDTVLDSPDDVMPLGSGPPIEQPSNQAEAHSMVLVEAALR